jgi:hypothetical protein
MRSCHCMCICGSNHEAPKYLDFPTPFGGTGKLA